jgi:hypothetical protein
MSAKKAAKKNAAAIPVPATDWRTTNRDEILRRVQRARDGKHSVSKLQQPAEADLITFNTRAIRHLTGDAPPAKPALTPEQIQRIADLKAFAAKKQKVARLLIEAAPPKKRGRTGGGGRGADRR